MISANDEIAGMKDRLSELLKNPPCDYLEIRLEDGRRTGFRFMGKDLEELEENHSAGIAIRALVDGSWGFITFNDFSTIEARVKDAINAARVAARATQGTSSLAPVEPVRAEIRPELLNDPRQVTLEDKLKLFSGYNRRVLAGEGVTSSVAAYFDKETQLIFANSEGTLIDRQYIDLACGVSAIATRSGDTRMHFVSQGSTNDYKLMLGLEDEIDKGIQAAVGKLDAPVIDAGTYTVICDPKLAGVFIHEAFGHLSEGDNLADDPQMQEVLTLGRSFGEDYLNVYDTGLDVGLRGYLPYDDEGVPTQHTDLIKEGRLVGRLHSRNTAGKLGEKPTGNARALNYRFPPIPRMRNTCIAPGPHGSFEEIISDVELGVYAISAHGGQTNGELFTFTAGDAFMIRNGEVAERVKDVTIGGNVFDTLRHIDRISSDFEVRDSAGGCGKAGQMPLPCSHGGPHIRIRECVIGGK